MYRQTGEAAIFDNNGIMKKGMIIRHLIFPNHILNSKRVLKWISDNMPNVCANIESPPNESIAVMQVNCICIDDED